MLIPARLNILLVLLVQFGILGSLWLSSRLGWRLAIPIGILISFVFLTNYALLHEAAHGTLHEKPLLNRLFGSLAGFLFPVSHSFLHIAHKVHHNNNRTDYEMFDYYYPDDNLLVKRAQWYSILTGIYPPIIPLGSVLMGFLPWVLETKPFAKAKSSSVLFANSQYLSADIREIRLEVLIAIVYWVVIWNLLSLHWLPVLIVYACCWFNWSTRQYVTHAFTPREVITGALNLKVSPLMSAILLRSQWDQVHHMHPDVPWVHLPEFADSTMQPVSYWRQYLALWKGPRPNIDPAPKSIA